MICFYQGTYGERIPQSVESIKRIRPYVDRAIIIVDETVTEEQKQQLKDLGCEVYFHPWEDSMVKMRNQALEKMQTDDWVVTSDPDEIFNEQFCIGVRELCERAEKNDIQLLLINSHDVLYEKDGTKKEGISDFFKNLIFKNKDGTHMEGVGEVKEVHEMLVIPGMTKAVRLPKDKYWYEHVKYWHEVWERAARNLFMAGGGNNAGTRNPSWKPLREICSSLGLDNWTRARDYLRKGNIDPRLKEWLWENRFEGFDFDHEEMEFGRWYFEYLHPEEAGPWAPVTDVRAGSPAEVMGFVEETYMKTLGRHADQEGKEYYTKMIVEGQMPREALPELLKRSQEYQQKVAQAGMESVRIQVPVNVDVKVSEDLFIQALMKSGTFWRMIKPRIDVGKFIELSLGEEGWKKFVEWFYTEKPELKEVLKKLKEGKKDA